MRRINSSTESEESLSQRTDVRLVRDDGLSICERCTVAATPLTRLKGLLGRAGLARGEGLVIRPAGAVHTCFMRFAIDVVFLDRQLRVLGVSPSLRPWRLSAGRGARVVLELAAGESERRGLRAGDRLRFAEPLGRSA
jgi:uncharacterized membrane protein (UPF0127 family)